MLLFKLITVFLFVLRINASENDIGSTDILLEITTGPSDVVVLVGQSATFTCEVVVNGTFNITWWKNGQEHENHHWHPNGSELLVTNIRQHRECANITCVVRSDGDEVRSSATLTVISTLNVSSVVGNVTGSSVEVSYSISPQLAEVSDLTFNIHYNSTTSVRQSSNDFTALNGVIPLTGLMPNTKYFYWVTAEAPDGIMVTSEVMDFKTSIVAPRVAPAVKNLTVLNSTAIVVEWFPNNDTGEVVIGYTITWQRQGHKRQKVENISDASVTSFVLTGLRKYTNYTISVAAYNSMGAGPDSEMALVQTDADVPETSVHNLTHNSITSTSISLSWDIRHGNKLHGPSQLFVIMYYPTADSEFNSEIINTYEMSYTLNNLSAYTEYTVTVSVYNGYAVGPHAQSVVRTAEGTPETLIHNLTIAASNSTSISLVWDIRHAGKLNGPLELFVVMYYPTEEGNFSVKGANTSNMSYTLNDLAPYTNYTIIVSVYNGYTTGPASQTVKTTAAGVPKTSILDLTHTNITSTSISLSWDIRHGDELNGPSQLFVIMYYPTEEGDLNIKGANTSNMSYTLNDLAPYTNYTIIVSVYNGYTIGPANQTVKTTAAGVPETSIHDLTHTNITSTSISLSWDIRHGDKLNGPSQLFVIMYYPTEEGDLNVKGANTSNMSYTLNDLAPYTNYTIIVSVYNGYTTGPANQTVKTTAAGVPKTSVHDLTHTNITSTSISLSWDIRHGNKLNGPSQLFVIMYYPTEEGDRSVKGANTSNIWYILNDLSAYTQYTITVTVDNGYFVNPHGRNITIRTDEGVPETSIHNLTSTRVHSTSISLSWDIRHADKLHGPSQLFVIMYYPIEKGDLNIKGANTSELSYTLRHLSAYTEYSITVGVFNGYAVGPYSENITVRTDEAAPSAPTGLVVTSVFPTNISIKWNSSHTPNGVISKYSVTCGDSSSTINASILHYDCNGLEPGANYTISIRAFTRAGGGVAENVTVTTPCELPTISKGTTKTREVNLTISKSQCSQARTQYLVIVQEVIVDARNRIVVPLKQLMEYTLQELKDSTRVVKQRFNEPLPVGKRQASANLLPVYIAANVSSFDGNFIVGDMKLHGGYRNYELESNSSYQVAVAIFIANQEEPSLYFSTPAVVTTESPTVIDTTTEASSGGDDDMLLIIIVAAAIIIAITLVSVILLFICCMCHGSRSTKGREKEELGTFERAGSLRSSINSIQLERNGTYRSSKKKKIVDPVEQRRSIIQTSELEGHPPIPVDGFLHKLSVLEECERQLFIDEFASLQDTSPEFTNDVALMDYNFAKNRYNNILPYDHSRVKLAALKHVPGSDYINANYCDGHMKYRGYVATQGPLPSTLGDFWRMIWEQRSSAIVMLTRLEEGDRIKCHCYWPREKEGAVTYGVIQVRQVESTDFADYSIRTFRLSKLGSMNEFTVTQFHFTSWPDHGVPSVTTTMLMFVRRVQAHCATLPEDSGPVTVHCSAGVGRTGCYIVIDSALTRLKENLSTIDIYGHVSLLRSQRPYMVQHEEQYFFTYEAVAEAIMCEDTECAVSDLSNHVEKLNQITEGSTLLEKEFKRLALEKGDPQQFISAKKLANKDKNRYVNVLPYETSRVVLDKVIGEECSDYINASYINGYFTKNLFIATQSPLAATMVDFWRMMWERRCPIVVMVMERGVERYWPVDRIKNCNHLSVEPTTERHSVDYTYREFKLTHATTDEVHIVRHFQFLGWPEVGVPSSGLPLIELMDEVNKMYQSLGTTAPITVHCKAGVAVTGVLVAMRVLLDQLKTERAVNVFQAVKVLRIQRPAMVQTMEQYRFLYDALVEYIGSDLHCRHGPSPALHSSCTKLPYYGNELLSSAHTFNSTTDVHTMQHSNI